MKDIINKLFTRSDTPLIKYVEMYRADAFERLTLGRGIHAHRIPLYRSGSILFDTLMDSGSTFEPHRHDCKEVITVEIGRVEHLGHVYQAGQQIIVHPYIEHGIRALDNSKLIVEFLEPYEYTNYAGPTEKNTIPELAG